MPERLADIVTQIENVRQLGAVVTAMRGISASRAQKSRSLLSGIDAYSRVISHAIGVALSLLTLEMTTTPAFRRTKCGLILFCAEQGFAGAFSERVLDAAASDIDGAICLVAGTRGTVVANERGIAPAWSAPMAANVDAMPNFANRLADALYGYVASGGIEKVDILYSRTTSGSGIRIDRHSLLPIDFRRFARPVATRPPLTTLRPKRWLERLAAEYVYAQLCEAAMHAFEAENEARMMTMVSAKTNIETKLAWLGQRERQLRRHRQRRCRAFPTAQGP
jgi:F-type H+-transporting ATPase subunit gamma